MRLKLDTSPKLGREFRFTVWVIKVLTVFTGLFLAGAGRMALNLEGTGYWAVSAVSGAWALIQLGGVLRSSGIISAVGRERRELRDVARTFRELEESLESGLVPGNDRWEKLARLPSPWGVLAHESVQELRSKGGAVLPTLKRLRALAEHHADVIGEARAKSAQALSQIAVIALLVPVFGAVLYVLLPGVSDRSGMWLLICLTALLFSACGAIWLISMITRARWAGLAPSQRCWVLAAQCMGERVLALIRCGLPPDLAWSRASQLLMKEAPELALRWGSSVFETAPKIPGVKVGSTAEALVVAGETIRKSILVSVMEGRACGERLESLLRDLRQELKTRIERELGLLGVRSLKPLFFFVAPSILGLLAAGMWMVWQGLGTPL